MEFREFKELVKQIPIGKQLPDAVYLHKSALEVIPEPLLTYIEGAIKQLKLGSKEWNLIKFYKRDHKIALLNYPTFFDYAYPELNRSYTINLENLSFRESNFSKSDNPPILHRKETFIKPDHPDHSTFKEVTEEGEKAGLYENTRNIGFRQSWERLINRKGYLLSNEGRLIPKSDNPENTPSASAKALKDIPVERHLTAIDRNKLSAPMQVFAKHNYLSGDFSILDYGCGKGDDVRELEAHGLNVNGWDPVHRSSGEKMGSDLVNLGYVINVIEERQERDQVLRDALSHTHLPL